MDVERKGEVKESYSIAINFILMLQACIKHRM